MNLAAPIALAVGGVAWSSVVHPGSETKPASESHVASAAHVAMPCDVPRVGFEVHGVETLDFFGQWKVQRASLSAFMGTFPGVRVPLMDSVCALAWCNIWLEEANKGRDIYEDLRTTGSIFTEDQEKLLGVMGSLKDEAPGKPTRYAREVTTLTSRLAASIDSRISIDFESGLPSNAELVGDSARDVAQGMGDGLAFTIESILVPIVGTAASVTIGVLASSLAPFLAVGAAIYIIRKKAS